MNVPMASPSFTLTSNGTMPADTFVRIIDVMDNVVNRAGLRNIGRRSLEASNQCEVYMADKNGHFNFAAGGSDEIRKSLLSMGWAEFRGRKAIEVRYSPVHVQFSIRVNDGYNCNTGCDDQVSYTVHANTYIQDVARFISAFSLSLNQSRITSIMVNKALEEESAYVLGNDIDAYGNVNPRLFYNIFRRLGLFLIGRPVIQNYQSARVKAIADKQKAWLEEQNKLSEEKCRISIDQERELTKALPRLIADLTAASVEPEEMQRAIETITAQVRASTQRIQASLDERLDVAKQDYLRTLNRIGNPEIHKPTRQNSAIGASNAVSGFLTNSRPASNRQRAETQYNHLNASAEPGGFGPYNGGYAPQRVQQMPRQAPSTGMPRYQPQVHQSFGPAQPENNDGTKHIRCRDCNTVFDFTEGEQAYFSLHSLEDPVRCPTCRKARKFQQGQQNVSQPSQEVQPLHFGRIIA